MIDLQAKGGKINASDLGQSIKMLAQDKSQQQEESVDVLMAKLAKKGKKIKVIDSDDEDEFKRDGAAPGVPQDGSSDGGSVNKKTRGGREASIERA